MLHLKFILLDAARMGNAMDEAKKITSGFVSLYKGRSAEELSALAPYLFSIDLDAEFYKWYLEKGWGNSWGILVITGAGFQDCYSHFRRFLIIKTEDKKQLYFRFYDPRVLKIFLPTCDKQQLLEFFGPVKCFIVEGDSKDEAIRFWQENGVLKQQQLAIGELFNENEQVIQ